MLPAFPVIQHLLPSRLVMAARVAGSTAGGTEPCVKTAKLVNISYWWGRLNHTGLDNITPVRNKRKQNCF